MKIATTLTKPGHVRMCIFYLFVQTMQVVRTTATTTEQEVQTITTTANPGQTIGGQFQIIFDMTAFGGSSQTRYIRELTPTTTLK